MKKLLCNTLLIFFFVFISPSFSQKPPGDIKKKADSVLFPWVVKIETETGNVGSGFVVNPSGYLITNNHLVEGSKIIKVTFPSGDKFPGKVMCQDTNLDLSLIELGVKNMPVAKLGNSSLVKVGDVVIVAGAPFGLDNTITKGVISHTDRQIGNHTYFQTDAAINPGNSGGPLINEKEEVVGVATFIRENSQGIGFAIPINDAVDFLNNSGISIVVSSDNIKYAFVPKEETKQEEDVSKETETVPAPIQHRESLLYKMMLLVFLIVIAFLSFILIKMKKKKRFPKTQNVIYSPKPKNNYKDVKIELGREKEIGEEDKK